MRSRLRSRAQSLLLLMLAPLLVSASSPLPSVTVFENEHVRVTELLAEPGALAGAHAQAPGVIVSLGRSRVEVTAEDGEPSLIDFYDGQVKWVDAQSWQSWRVIAGRAHLFHVEPKASGQGHYEVAAPLAPDHSTVIDPDQHHLIFENDRVRVIDGMAAAGAVSPRHTHPPSVLLSLAKSRFKVTINAKTRIFDFEPATVRWTNHFEHEWRILSGDARVIMVEIKSAHGDPKFHRRY